MPADRDTVDQQHPAAWGAGTDGAAGEDAQGLSGLPSHADTADTAGAADLTGSVQARLSFRQAQGLLAGLCGCTEQRAAQALLSTAARHGIASAHIGAQFLAALESDPATRSEADRDHEDLVINLIEAAVLPPDGRGLQRSAPPTAQPESRPDVGQASTRPARGDAKPLNGPAALPFLVIYTERESGLIVEGELDLATAPQLQAAVTKFGWPARTPDHDSPSLQLDLNAVTFIDISGAHALNNVHAHVAAQGGQLHVTPPAGRGPRRLLQYAVDSGWLAPLFAPEDPTNGPADSAH